MSPRFQLKLTKRRGKLTLRLCGVLAAGCCAWATLGADTKATAVTNAIAAPESTRLSPGTNDVTNAISIQPALTNVTSSAKTNTTDGRDSPRAERSRQGGRGRNREAARATSPADFAAFSIVAERNIFNPNRAPRRDDGPRPRPRIVDSLTLVGVMTYDKGTFAFFDGTSSAYRKALKANDSIAGFKVTTVEPNSVKLASDKKQLELALGSSLRREDQGEWQVSTQIESYVASPGGGTGAGAAGQSSPPSAAPAPTGADSDVLKRLMQRREQE